MPITKKDLTYDENLELLKWKAQRIETGYTITIKGQEEAYLAGFEAGLKSAAKQVVKLLRETANELEGGDSKMS